LGPISSELRQRFLLAATVTALLLGHTPSLSAWSWSGQARHADGVLRRIVSSLVLILELSQDGVARVAPGLASSHPLGAGRATTDEKEPKVADVTYRNHRGLSEAQQERLAALERQRTITQMEAGEARFLAHQGNRQQEERALKIIGRAK
jgi:hypothetical protein